MAQQDRYEHRSHIDGIPHCPECGGMLWPPEYTGPVVCENGDEEDSILEADPSKVHFHEECYEKRQGKDTEAYQPDIESENGSHDSPISSV